MNYLIEILVLAVILLIVGLWMFKDDDYNR